MYALIEEEENRSKFTLYEKEADAQRAGARKVMEGLKEGGFEGVDVAPILEALADGNWMEAIATYNAFGLKEQLYVTEEEVEGLVKGPSAAELQVLQEVLL